MHGASPIYRGLAPCTSVSWVAMGNSRALMMKRPVQSLSSAWEGGRQWLLVKLEASLCPRPFVHSVRLIWGCLRLDLHCLLVPCTSRGASVRWIAWWSSLWNSRKVHPCCWIWESYFAELLLLEQSLACLFFVDIGNNWELTNLFFLLDFRTVFQN